MSLRAAAFLLACAAAGMSGRAAAGEPPRRSARKEADLLARAGEARYRLALLRSGGDDLERAVRALEEARGLDPANLRALAYLGLARLALAARDDGAPDREGLDSAREALSDLFKLSRGWADPQTRLLLKEVARALDAALGGGEVTLDDGKSPEARTWWRSWRGQVTKAAASAPPGAGVATLVEDLRASPLAWVRERAAEKLGERKGKLQPGVVEALGLALRGDKSAWVRAAAVKAFAALRPPGWDVRLAEALQNDDSVFVRRTCAREFGSIHVSHSPPKRPLDKTVRAALVKALLSDTPRVAAAAARTLGKFEEAEDELLRALESPSSRVRGAASGGLASWAREKKVLDRLVELLSDKQPGIRLVALRTLPPARDVSEHIWQKILERLADSDPLVRATAADKFYDTNGLSAEARPRIEKLLQDDDPRVRLAAASVLGKTNDAARRVLESLRSSEVPTGAAGSSTVGTRARTILGELPETDIKELLDELLWLDE